LQEIFIHDAKNPSNAGNGGQMQRMRMNGRPAAFTHALHLVAISCI
jgi:hypothetical protein